MLELIKAGGWTMLPIGLACVYIAAELTVRVWAATPENASLVAFAILGVGALLACAVALWERYSARGSRRGQVKALTKTVAAGYLPDRKPLLLALPEKEGATATEIACWARRGRTYLDLDGCLRLRTQIEDRWDALRKAEAQPPTGSRILAAVDVRYRIPLRRDRPEARISTVAVPGGDNDLAAASMNEDGLIDVTDLGLV